MPETLVPMTASKLTSSQPTIPNAAYRILVVEDCQPNQFLAMALLGAAGYRVEAAADGGEAVRAVAGGGYDLVLMDLSMPGMDGLTATRLLRDLPPPLCDVPILAMTADTTEADRARCLDAGMNDHIGKPFERQQLLRTVAHWLGDDDCADSWQGQGEATDSPGGAALDRVALVQLAADLGPELLADVLRQFIDETTERVSRISREPDLALLTREAHTLKSTAGTFGASALASVARSLELACRSGLREDVDALRATLPYLAGAAVAAYREDGWLS